MFDIFISDSKGDLLKLQVEKTYTTNKVKEIVKKIKKIENIELIFNGIILNDNETLEKNDIEANSTLNYLGIFNAGRDKFEIIITDISNEKVITLKNNIKNNQKWNAHRKGLNISELSRNKCWQVYENKEDYKIR